VNLNMISPHKPLGNWCICATPISVPGLRPLGARNCRYRLSFAPIVCGVILASFAAIDSFAQNAGQILQQIRPMIRGVPKVESDGAVPSIPAAPTKAPLSDGPKFLLREVIFERNTVYLNQTLQNWISAWRDKEITLAQLQELAEHVAIKYHEDGYLLAEVIIPEQTIDNGKVRAIVLEGLLAKPPKVTIDSDAPVRSETAARFLSLLQPGKPIRKEALERTMLLLSDIPGITAQSFLQTGEEPGTSDLIVDISPAKRRVDFSVEADNHGSRITGEYRAGMTLRVKSPFKIADSLEARLLTSSALGLVYGRVGYELPLGYAGTRVGVAGSRVRYDLGQEFAQLDANGEADVLEVSLGHPLLRSRAQNLLGRLFFENKETTDRVGAVSSQSDKRIRNIGAGLVFEGRDRFLCGAYERMHKPSLGSNAAKSESIPCGGYLNFTLTGYLGDVTLESSSDFAADQSPTGRHTAGDFGKVVYQASRLQTLPITDSTLFLGVTGQWASKNLDSAERIALGGPRAVRAYGPSEAIVDEGEVLNVEYRYSIRPELTLSAFFDAAWGRLSAKPLALETENRRALRGYGLELLWTYSNRFSLRLSAAARQSGPPRADTRDRIPQIYLQLGASL
jgi:hemolysin activation/secretion protein